MAWPSSRGSRVIPEEVDQQDHPPDEALPSFSGLLWFLLAAGSTSQVLLYGRLTVDCGVYGEPLIIYTSKHAQDWTPTGNRKHTFVCLLSKVRKIVCLLDTNK